MTPNLGGGPVGGYAPNDLQSAYNLTAASAGGSGAIVAVVDAYDDPTAEADLGTYRGQYGLPACTTANSCFKKVSETGSTTSLPHSNAGWSEEEALDVDMVSAICPNCKILLVEATSATFADLAASVNEAVALGTKFVSNSYGGSEFFAESSSDSAFNHPGVAITASSGDSGYGVEYPAASRYVTAVGGTSLVNTSGVWSETAWSGAGSGCSAYEPQPAGQTATLAAIGGCARRAVADVSAVADPSTGVAVYANAAGGWAVFGGTSVASPIVASVYALAGTPGASDYPASYPYAHPTALNDVQAGSNGVCGSYLCTARVGFDGPTGLGTPNGAAAFTASTGGGSGGTTTVPGQVTNLHATVSGTTVTLTWTAPTSNGGSPITTYDVQRTFNSGPTTSIPTGSATTTFTDSSLAPGSYSYTVAARNINGDGAASVPATATISGQPPAITSASCKAATCTFTGTGTPTLTWTFGNNATATGSPVTTTYVSAGTYKVTLSNGVGPAATHTVSCRTQRRGRTTTLTCSA